MAESRHPLSDLRERIDEIDDALHDLLMRRSALVEEIADVKREDGVVMRSGVMHAITERRATVGLLPLGTSERDVPWWLFLARRAADTPRVIARLPFVLLPDRPRDHPEALVLGLVPPEASGEDHSLLIIETRQELSRAALAAELGGAGFQRSDRGILEYTADSRRHLIEVDGFVEDDDPRLSDLISRDGEVIVQVSVAGAFALPVGDGNGKAADAAG
jgi:hypothetical protein